MLPIYLTLPDNNDLLFRLRNGEAFLDMSTDGELPPERHVSKEALRRLVADLQELLGELEKCDG